MEPFIILKHVCTYMKIHSGTFIVCYTQSVLRFRIICIETTLSNAIALTSFFIDTTLRFFRRARVLRMPFIKFSNWHVLNFNRLCIVQCSSTHLAYRVLWINDLRFFLQFFRIIFCQYVLCKKVSALSFKENSSTFYATFQKKKYNSNIFHISFFWEIRN